MAAHSGVGDVAALMACIEAFFLDAVGGRQELGAHVRYERIHARLRSPLYKPQRSDADRKALESNQLTKGDDMPIKLPESAIIGVKKLSDALFLNERECLDLYVLARVWNVQR